MLVCRLRQDAACSDGSRIGSLTLVLRNQVKGPQSTMLMISVVVVALVSASYTFAPTFKTGVEGLGADVARILRTGKVGDAAGRQFKGVASPGLDNYAPYNRPDPNRAMFVGTSVPGSDFRGSI